MSPAVTSVGVVGTNILPEKIAYEATSFVMIVARNSPVDTLVRSHKI
jgi:hypothetical protein